VSRRAPRFALAAALGGIACAGEPAPGPARGPAPEPESATAASIALGATTDAAPRSAADSADLDVLCRALHDDYGDGTLSDSFARTRQATPLGRAVRARAEASDRPGRVLEDAVGGDTSALPSCRALFGDLVDLE
jgi:hypothetical protein